MSDEAEKTCEDTQQNVMDCAGAQSMLPPRCNLSVTADRTTVSAAYTAQCAIKTMPTDTFSALSDGIKKAIWISVDEICNIERNHARYTVSMPVSLRSR